MAVRGLREPSRIVQAMLTMKGENMSSSSVRGLRVTQALPELGYPIRAYSEIKVRGKFQSRYSNTRIQWVTTRSLPQTFPFTQHACVVARFAVADCRWQTLP